MEAALLVKTTISAAGANFAFGPGQEFEWEDLKALVGTGAENFCTPADDTVAWPPVVAAAEAEAVVDDVPAEAPAEEAPEPAKRGRRR